MTDNPFDHIPDAGAAPAAPAAPAADPFAHIPEQVSNYDTSKVGRFMTGVKEPIYGAGQLLAHLTGYGADTMDKKVSELEKHYQAQRAGAGIKPEDWDYTAGLGNIASPINYLPGAAAGRVLGAAGKAATLAGRMGEGALAGASQGAFTPVAEPGNNYGDQKVAQAGVGAIAGTAGAPIGRALAGSMAPEVTPAARQLMNEGVELTGPQAAGGFLKKIEDVLAGSPVGGSITKARQRGIESFDRAAGDRALAPIGERVPESLSNGHAIINDVEDKLGQAYERVHSGTTLHMDPELQNDLMAVGQQHRTLGPERLQQLQAFIDQNIEEPLRDHGGVIPGDIIHGGASNLRREASNLASDPNAFTRNLGMAVQDVHDAMNAALERQNPGFAAQLQQANTGWANFVRMRQAAATTGAQNFEGTFTPAQFGAATKAADKSAGKGASARGNALGQDLAEAGKGVMPSKIPDSGTAQRAAAMAMIGGHLAVSPQTAILHAILPLLYSPTGVRLQRALLTGQRPAAIQAMGSPIAGMMPRATATAGLSAMNPNTNEAIGQNFANKAVGQ